MDGKRDPRLAVRFPIALMLLTAVALGAAGCELPDLGGDKKVSIKEPPYIPALPVRTRDSGSKAPIMYADIAALGEGHAFHPDLKTAVQTAINHDILTPAHARARFNPEEPVTYADFREWTHAYGDAQAYVELVKANPFITPEGELSPDAEALLSPQEPAGDEGVKSPPIEALSQNAEAGDPRRLPPNILWDGHRLGAQAPVSRQELAALYATLADQLPQARMMSEKDIEASRPEGAPKAERLSEFKDFGNIDPWALKYVALAYRDGLFKDIFNLSPAQLIETVGLQPARPVTRGEALVFLHRFFNLPETKPEPQLVTPRDIPEEAEADAATGKPPPVPTPERAPARSRVTAPQ